MEAQLELPNIGMADALMGIFGLKRMTKEDVDEKLDSLRERRRAALDREHYTVANSLARKMAYWLELKEKMV